MPTGRKVTEFLRIRLVKTGKEMSRLKVTWTEKNTGFLALILIVS